MAPKKPESSEQSKASPNLKDSLHSHVPTPNGIDVPFSHVPRKAARTMKGWGVACFAFQRAASWPGFASTTFTTAVIRAPDEAFLRELGKPLSQAFREPGGCALRSDAWNRGCRRQSSSSGMASVPHCERR